MTRLRSRFFARCWAFQVRHESPALARMRRETASLATGRVLEIGAGAGTNLACLPPGIEYTGIEPNPFLRGKAMAAAESVPSAQVLDMSVTDLSFADASFDTVLTTLTFCSVASPRVGLGEVFRVLKPGGQLLFLEHVRAARALLARGQRLISPLTRTFGDGCEWHRDTLREIVASGFEVELVNHGKVAILPVVWGKAVKPSAHDVQDHTAASRPVHSGEGGL